MATTFDKYGFDAGKNKYDIDDLAEVKQRLAALETKTAKLTGDGCPFQIGGIYISTKSTSPKSIWPGTDWTPMKAGRVLLACNQTNPNASVEVKDFKGDVIETFPVAPNNEGGHYQSNTTLFACNLPWHVHDLPGSLKFHHHDLAFPQATYPNPSSNPPGTEYSDSYGLPTDTRVYTEASGTVSDTRYYTLRVDTQSQEIGWAIRNVYDTSGQFDPSHIIGVSTAHGTLKTSNNSHPDHPITTTHLTIPDPGSSTGINYTQPTDEAIADIKTEGNVSDPGYALGRSVNVSVMQPYIAVYMWQRIK